MKKLLPLYFLALSFFLLSSCDKDPKPSPDPNQNTTLRIDFETKYGGNDLKKNELIYKNSHNELYSISFMRYYISHITLIKENGSEITEYNAKNYSLVDPFEENMHSADLTFPAGHYQKIKFTFGIPLSQNHTASSEGFLNVSYGMTWTWNFGYIFLKHEGQAEANGSQESITYHLGTDEAIREITLPIDLNLNENSNELHLQLNVDQIYQQASSEVFLTNPVRHSTSADDNTWIREYADNIATSFRVY